MAQVRMLYRTLLRTSRAFDAHPEWKALLFLPDLHNAAGALAEAPPLHTPAAQAVTQLRATFTHGLPYQPEHGSLYSFIRKQFRAGDAAVHTAGGADAVQVALQAQSDLLRVAAVAQAVGNADAFQLPTVLPELSGELRPTLSIDNGTLLLEHVAVGGSTSPGAAVVAVYDLDQHHQESDGDSNFVVRGLVVNRPFPFQVKEVFPNLELGPLGDLHLWQGGTHDESLYIMHRVPGIKNAVEIHREGLWIGGDMDALADKLSNGEAMPEDFKILLGCSVWEAENEAAASSALLGTFSPATGSAAPSVALMPPVPIQGEYADAVEAAIQAAHEGTEEEGVQGGYEHEKFWHQNAVWAACMHMMGGEFARIGAMHPVVSQVLAGVLADPEEYAVAGVGTGSDGGAEKPAGAKPPPLEPEIVSHPGQ